MLGPKMLKRGGEAAAARKHHNECMQRLAETAERIGATTKKTEKVAILAEYLRARSLDEAAASAVFLSGRAFPAWEETTLGVGGTQLWRVVVEVADTTDTELTRAYRRHGDLGSATQDVFAAHEKRRRVKHENPPSVLEVAESFRGIARARGVAPKTEIVRALLARCDALSAKYVVKIITGELRIGLKESLVEEAIAKAFDEKAAAVQRANMLLGDIGEALRLASAHKLGEAQMRLLHPIGFMLASPAETAEEAFEYFIAADDASSSAQSAIVEDKYDGIRAQAHVSGDQVRLFSRTLDDITGSFPELIDPLLALPDGVILDGEILAWDFNAGRALAFSELQKRLGRKKVSEAMLRDTPVAYVAFDVLYRHGELVIDRPLQDRAKLLDEVFEEAVRTPRADVARTRLSAQNPQGQLEFEAAVVDEHPFRLPSAIIRAPQTQADSAEHLDELFTQAQARGNEGLMIKDVNSPYTPGRRGRSWLKLKRELATLDVVVTSVEWGHGKRNDVLSDVTFAVRAGDELLNVGKAYSGLTDKEIAELTQWFLEHTVHDHGFWREVKPELVLEVAFNAVMRSDRHNSGFALRFPRIVRIRTDKSVEEIDTLERVEEVYAMQQPLKRTA
jgi:DNA ligase 1